MSTETKPARRAALAVTVLAALAALTGAGCRQDMHDQPRYEPLEASEFFEDGRASRLPVEGTVYRGGLREDELLHTGKITGEFAAEIPMSVSRELLERGRERYDIFCAPCHDRTGSGLGMAVRRGFPRAASLHIDRLRNAEPGYLFDVITRGFGRMPDYASQIGAGDRWAIVAYIRALQVSQNTPVASLPEAERPLLDSGGEGH